MKTLREVGRIRAGTRTQSRKAFTLVELLVVIAIIGILITIILPAVQKALFKGQLTQAAANAKSLHTAIVVRNMATSMYGAPAGGDGGWPAYGATTEPTNNTFASSTDYLRHLVTNGTLEVNFNFFAMKGVPLARSGAEFQSTNCPWSVVAGITDSYPATAPALFTRNLDISTIGQTLTVGARGVVQELGDAATPFGSQGFVFVTCGGGAYSLSAENLRLQVFTNLFIRTAVDGTSALTNRVLRP